MDDHASKRQRLSEASPTETEILQLVSQREAHRQRQQFAESDMIRQQLRDLGVELYDKDREWRAKDGRRGVLFTAGPYECTLSNAEIQAKIEEREEARRAKEWERSNILRDELRANGVELSDKDSVWRTLRGRQGHYAGGTRGSALSGVEIHRLVCLRERHREARDYDEADRVRAQLAQNGVEVFDAERLWKATDGRQGCMITGGVEIICGLSDSEISHRVAQREEARSAKRWADADTIRDDLRRQGVETMDAQKVWCTTDGRQGPYPGQAASAPPLSLGALGGGGGVVNDIAAQAIAGLALMAQRGQVSPEVSAALAAQLVGSAVPAAAHAGGGGALHLASPAVGANAFQQLPGAPPFADATIVALITAREMARDRHDWAAADAIRGDLRNHGVEVWDKEKVWKCVDGRHGQIHSTGGGGGAASALSALGALGLTTF